MKKIILLLLLTYTTKITSIDPENSKDMEFFEGIKIEPKVNFSVSDGNQTLVPLAKVLNFYNTELLAANWDKTKNLVTSSCRKDVELYLKGLKRVESWALKSKFLIISYF